jgi:hypothetical protein
MKNLISKEEKDRIDSICNKYYITKYTIKSDGTINVNGDVRLDSDLLDKLPLIFGKVNGDFRCDGNYLTSLKGAPHTVGGDFLCQGNKLTSLTGGPEKVNGDYSCGQNNLESLTGAPRKIGGQFDCSYNYITTLVGGPSEVGSGYYCKHNKLTTFEGLPAILNDNVNISSNQIISSYSGDVDIEPNGGDNDKFSIDPYHLPGGIIENITHLKLILKYQRHFFIWNDDLTLNVENFEMLLDEIKDGLL